MLNFYKTFVVMGQKKDTTSSTEKFKIYSPEEAFQHLTQIRSEEEQQLYVATDEILFHVWDALCISIDKKCRDEYLPYLPHVFDLLKNTSDGREIYEYLIYIEERLGTPPGDNLAPRRANRTVDILLKYRTAILRSSSREEE
ncbi:hypothetical protein DGMP_16260 [Desulfomarina profundi]|uniref:Uncharacterized protein n=2 Tax=Desulfomarina profundi TaxID=2772557 RepID=A0A8D5JDD3_9BACT|nr:hypothetical protein DGMP_16260 [Desulfomarina profundi]